MVGACFDPMESGGCMSIRALLTLPLLYFRFVLRIKQATHALGPLGINISLGSHNNIRPLLTKYFFFHPYSQFSSYPCILRNFIAF